MPRTIQISVPHERTGSVLERMRGVEGVVGITLQAGASLKPPGDVVIVQTTNDASWSVLHALDELDVLDGGSILTSEVQSLISRPSRTVLEKESSETIWEEAAFLLRRETNVAVNYLLLMALSGSIAAAGLWTNTLHLVIAAMVIAPGFEPFVRIPFALLGGRRIATQGLLSVVTGYLALAVSAGVTLLVYRVIDPGASSDLGARSWVRYWSQITASSTFLAVVAGIAGAVVVTGQQAVLTIGVMIALALIPAMSIAGMGLAMLDLSLAGEGLLRWLLDAAVVTAMGALVLGLKQAFLHRRPMLG
jgi:hypothetical protein